MFLLIVPLVIIGIAIIINIPVAIYSLKIKGTKEYLLIKDEIIRRVDSEKINGCRINRNTMTPPFSSQCLMDFGSYSFYISHPGLLSKVLYFDLKLSRELDYGIKVEHPDYNLISFKYPKKKQSSQKELKKI